MRKVIALLLCAPLVFPHEPVRFPHAMVAAEEALAADVGARVLRSGGNAVDAAVAVGFALAVTHPFAGNLGGGGFMLVRLTNGKSTFIDFRERAPLKATRDMYLDASGKPNGESTAGWKSAGVPGTVRGFALAHQKYGSKKWSELLAPSVKLAKQGFQVNYLLARSLNETKKLKDDPETRRVLLRGGQSWTAGEMLMQADLAATLTRISERGADGFYEGETAQRLVQEMGKHSGMISLEDLHGYQAVEREPIEGTYRNFRVISAPPPSAGGLGLLQMLGMLDGSGYEKGGAGSAAVYHYLAEVMRRFFADRSAYLGDPDFVKNPLAALLDPAYLRARRASIDPDRATPSVSLRGGLPSIRKEGTQTVHYDVVDAQGNIAALTYTLNDGFGNGIMVPGLGFLLNDEMDDFTSAPGRPNLFGVVQGETNAIVPGKRPVSSMTPTIVLRDGKPYLVLGTPGGSRIPTAVLQVMLNVMDFGMNVQDAVDFPRIHHQWQPDRLFVDRNFSPDTIALLKARGHTVDDSPGVVPPRVTAILIGDGILEGATDGRNTRNVNKVAGY